MDLKACRPQLWSFWSQPCQHRSCFSCVNNAYVLHVSNGTDMLLLINPVVYTGHVSTFILLTLYAHKHGLKSISALLVCVPAFICITTVTVSWAVSTSQSTGGLQLCTVPECLLCGQTPSTGAAAALLMCWSHYTVRVDMAQLL